MARKRYAKRRRRTKRFKRRRKMSNLTSYQKRLRRSVKQVGAAPNIWKWINTFEADDTTDNKFAYPLDFAHSGNVASSPTCDDLYHTEQHVALGYSGVTNPEDYNWVIAGSWNEFQMKNTASHEAEIFIYKMMPKICLNKELYTHYGAEPYDPQDLVQKMMDSETGSFPTANPSKDGEMRLSDFDIIKRYFKVLKIRKKCLLPGETLRLKIKGKRWYSLPGAFLEDYPTGGMFMYPHGWKGTFLLVRTRGTIAHGITDDSTIGRLGTHFDIVNTFKSLMYSLPVIKKSIVVTGTLDTMTGGGEAINDADKVAAADAEE